MSLDSNDIKILRNIIDKSKKPNIIIVEPDFEDSILRTIDLSKKKSLLIHGISSNFKNEYKNIAYSGFSFSNIDFDTHNDKKKNVYTLDFIFSLLKWSKIDFLKIDQNEFKVNTLMGAENIFSRQLINVTIIKNNNNLLNKEEFLRELIQFSYKFNLKIYILENSYFYSLTEDNFDTFNFQNQDIVMVKNNYELEIKILSEPALKNLVLKKITTFFGNLPFFKGQDRIIRFLYPPNKFKNLNKGEKFLVNYFGVKYIGITSNYIDWGVYFKGGHEKSLVNFFKNKISKFDYFFDIGANSGTISLPFIFEDNLKIICFEPLKYSFNKLEKNFKTNNAPSRHQLHRIAISNHKGNSKIYYSKTNENPGFASINNYFEHQDLSTEEVELNTIDNLFKIKNKNLIFKVDVEGYEKKAIEGAFETLKNNKVLMYLESRNRETIDDLKKIGFKEKYISFKGDKIKFLKNKKSQDILLQNF